MFSVEFIKSNDDCDNIIWCVCKSCFKFKHFAVVITTFLNYVSNHKILFGALKTRIFWLYLHLRFEVI
jgi:hypothetical protein